MTCVVTIDDILIKRSHFKGVIEIKDQRDYEIGIIGYLINKNYGLNSGEKSFFYVPNLQRNLEVKKINK